MKSVELHEFLQASGCIFDVRSPGEFAQGHLPGAFNLPLFSNEERTHIGTVYKQIGRKEAVLQGMALVAPKFPYLVESIENILKSHPFQDIAKIHCWRGGMRSSSLTMFLEMAGFKCITLKGGYKTFRRWVLKILEGPFKLNVLGGMTGCGKTSILQTMERLGAQVIDLEAIANHRGSSFGMIGMQNSQPSNEQFENAIAFKISSLDPSKHLWIENESRLIGNCKIPDSLYLAMKSSPLFVIERPLIERLNQIQEIYWTQDTKKLAESAKRLAKKLGGEKVADIIGAIEIGNLHSATLRILEYYDRTYQHEMLKHQLVRPQTILYAENFSDEAWASRLINLS
ncbi:MAG: tRNA 2-selenouridine(34) synthase MnmH [Parachlamydiaceae bacterium]|nr:tRNA 2-selenouridine(34) synthase MnmH [Parachlamydiaceae bacterium]